MAIPTTNLSDNINEFREDHNTLANNVGDLTNLTTDSDASIVAAINSVDSNVGDRSLLTTSDKTDVVSAINEINFELHGITDGDGSNLNTDANTLVGAINELNDSIGDGVLLSTTAQTIKAAINELNDSIGSGGLNTTQQTLIGAINEHDTELGTITSGAMGTTASTVSTAINELDGRLDSINNTQLNTAAVLTGTLNATSASVTDSSQFQSNLSVLGQTTTEDLLVSDSAFIGGNLNVIGNVGVAGNLDVQGTVNFIASNTVELGDNIISLNADLTGNPPQNSTTDAGLEVNRGSYTDVNLIWDETSKYWVAAYDSDNSLAQIVTTGDTTIITNGMLAGSIANAKLVNSKFVVTDGSTPSDINLGDTLTFSNVTNETTVSQSGGTVTIGLPDDVDITGDLSIGGAFSVAGNLQISGETKSLSNFLTLLDSNTAAGIPSGFSYVAGLKIDRGTEPNYNFVYDDSADNWRWYDSDASARKYTFLTTNNITLTSPLSIDSDLNGNTTWSIDDATTGAKGIASFSSSDFSVSSGAVSIKALGVSNAQLAGSITNAKLTNSTIRINSTTISLGDSATLTTDNIAEGSSNLYYDSARTVATARNAIKVIGSGTYDSANGIIDIQGGVTSVNGNTGAVVLITDSIGEGSSNLYYTKARTDSDVNQGFTDRTTDNLSEGATNKYFSTAQVDAHLSGTAPIGYSSGAISISNASTAAKGAASFNSSDFSVSSGAVSIKSLGVSNAQLAGSIENAKLVNSSITINGSSVSLGGSVDLADSAGGLSNGYTNSSSIGLGSGFAGVATSGATNNTVIGQSAGAALDSGDNNVILGYAAGLVVQNDRNTLVGSQAGMNFVQTYSTSNSLLAIGYQAGFGVIGIAKSNQNAVAVGDYALGGATTTEADITNTIAIGASAGFNSPGAYGNNAYQNVLIGANAGYELSSAGAAFNNTFVGHTAGNSSTSGSNNILIGFNAQKSSATASNEITLGDVNVNTFRVANGDMLNASGHQNAANGIVVKNANNRVASDLEPSEYIYHSGDLDTYIRFPAADQITITAGGVDMIEMVEGATDYIDFVDTMRITAGGDLECENDIIAFTSTSISDENLKENIEVIPDALTKVEFLKGVTFDWKDKEETSAGLIAQDVEKILPQAVKDKKIRDGEEFKALNYDGVVGLLVEAVKELSARVKELESK